MENGKPVMVLMGMEAYRELKRQNPQSSIEIQPVADQADIVNAKLEEERLRAKELALRFSMEPARLEIKPAAEPVAAEPSRIRLEDLPL